MYSVIESRCVAQQYIYRFIVCIDNTTCCRSSRLLALRLVIVQLLWALYLENEKMVCIMRSQPICWVNVIYCWVYPCQVAHGHEIRLPNHSLRDLLPIRPLAIDLSVHCKQIEELSRMLVQYFDYMYKDGEPI